MKLNKVIRIYASSLPKEFDDFGVSPTTGIQLENGVLVTAYRATCGQKENMHVSVNLLVYSRDYGRTWQLSPYTIDGIIADECTLAEYEPNQVMINARGGTEAGYDSPNMGRRVFIPTSPCPNEREKWMVSGWQTHVSDRQLIEPICNASFIAVKIDNKRIGLFCNPHVKYNPRRNMTLQYSEDFCHWHSLGLLSVQDRSVWGYCSLYYQNERLSYVYEDMERGILFADITEHLRNIEHILSKNQYESE